MGKAATDNAARYSPALCQAMAQCIMDTLQAEGGKADQRQALGEPLPDELRTAKDQKP